MRRSQPRFTRDIGESPGQSLTSLMANFMGSRAVVLTVAEAGGIQLQARLRYAAWPCLKTAEKTNRK